MRRVLKLIRIWQYSLNITIKFKIVKQYSLRYYNNACKSLKSKHEGSYFDISSYETIAIGPIQGIISLTPSNNNKITDDVKGAIRIYNRKSLLI